MSVIDFKEAQVGTRDPSVQTITGRVEPKVYSMPLFTTRRNAAWSADRILKVEAYPVAAVEIVTNRHAFRLQPGDAFRLTYSDYSLSEKVFRVAKIIEEDIENEKIRITAIEDINYIASEIEEETGETLADETQRLLSALVDVAVFEAPYALVEKDAPFYVVTIAGRETRTEIGYKVMLSLDNSTYSQIGVCTTYAIHGVLTQEYTEDTVDIDDDIGLYVTFDNDDDDLITTITRAEMLAGANLAVIGSTDGAHEIISFQTITPVSGHAFILTGVYRGRFDTLKQTHALGTAFWFLGTSRWGKFNSTEIKSGATRYFKLIPYNKDFVGDESEATAKTLVITGRQLEPYPVINLKANSGSANPLYTADIVLTWDARKRGVGAGTHIGMEGADATDVWEGYFEVQVIVGVTTVRTTTAIDDDTWIYTEAMNLADNVSLASSVTLKVRGYRTVDNLTYYSDWTQITVTLEV